jgi:S1/P1 Nuclease
MFRKLLIVAAAALLAAGTALAWNPAGHMVTGSIAYDELQRNAPATVARVVAILRQHPQYESLWKPQLAGMSEPDQQRYLFMLAARWPDDIRRNRAFDHPEWHYIDYPYKPPGQPGPVRVPAPPADNLVTAFQRNVAVIQSAAPAGQKAIALCWIFHLLGDAHQPLHTVSLFTTQFPKGDRGGNLFYISLYKPANPASSVTENLHAYWDNILLTDDHYGAARQRATALENAHPRRSLDELAEPQFETWVKKESFGLAVSTVYRRGNLKGSTDRNRGTPLPRDYPAAAKRVAERRVALAGYRLADFLRTNFP